MVSSSISFQLVCVTRFTTDPDVNKRREKEEEENKSVQQKRILKGREQTEKKIHYVSDRNHWVRKTTYPIRVLLI